jgi:hypothetical protein
MFSIRIGRILKFFGLPGSGSVTICMDPDPSQNVTDPEHCFLGGSNYLENLAAASRAFIQNN